MNTDDLRGTKFGELLVVNRVENYVRPSGRITSRYLCVCSCGAVTIVRGDYLRNGHTTSCGKCKGERTKAEREAEKQKPVVPDEYLESDRCCYQPKGVLCDEIQCFKCGWNPWNKELRRERVEKVLAKRGEEKCSKQKSSSGRR